MDLRAKSSAPAAGLPAPAPARGRWPAGPRAWRSRDVLRVTLIVTAVYCALRLLWFAQALVLTAFLGVLFGLAIARGVDLLARFRVPRGVAAGAIVAGFYALLYGLGAWSAPTLTAQFAELRARLPEATDKVDAWLAAHRDGVVGQMLGAAGDTETAPAAGEPGTAGAGREATGPPEPGSAAPAGRAPAPDLRSTIRKQTGAVARFLFPFLSSTVAVVGGLLLVTFLAIYIASEPELYRRGLLRLFPPGSRGRAAEVLGGIAATLRRWLLTQLVAMVTIGVVTTVALMLLGVKAAVSLGLIAGLFEFIPTIGPLLSAVPAVAMGFIDSPQKALLVALVYTGIQFLENHILIPLLMKEGMDLPPAVTILGQALLALLFGFLGLLVAVPLIAAVMVTVKMLYVEDVLGEEIATPDDAPA